MTKKTLTLYEQAGAVPYTLKKGVTKFILITSKKGHWIFPKGLMETNMTSWGLAAKEAIEEAGIEGKVSPSIVGEYQYEKWDGICEVKMHLMQVNKIHDTWEEMKIRKRKLVTFDEALEIINTKQLEILLSAADILGLVRPDQSQNVA